MDVFSKAKRAAIMSAVKGRDTGPELAVRRALHALGLRYRLHDRALPGRPDVVFKAARVAVFVHGCFWHQHTCPRGTRPTSHSAFWRRKLAGNVARDRRALRGLRAMGWRAVLVWECQAGSGDRLAAVSRRIVLLVRARTHTRSQHH